MATPPSERHVGTVLDDRFELTKLRGRTAVASVYSGVDTTNGAEVEVKRLHPQLAGDATQRQRFTREILALSRIQHPSIAALIHHGSSDDGGIYLVIQPTVGEPVSALITRLGALPPDRATAIAAAVARTLAAAHAVGVVHRNLGPTNILVHRTPDHERGHVAVDTVMVTDFGMARLLESAASDITRADERLGNHVSMAPEYVQTGQLDHRADLYALGVVLYALLTGAPPFVGPSLKVLQQHVSEQVTEPSLRAPGIPRWLDDLTLSLLAKDPEDRPGDATVVAQILQARAVELAATEAAHESALLVSSVDDEVASPRGTGAVTMPQDKLPTPAYAADFARQTQQPTSGPAWWALALLAASTLALLATLAFAWIVVSA